MLKTKIMIRTEFKGTHNWPEASQFAGDQVKFLEHVHRHTFKVQAELSVSDPDREVEFFVFQDQVDNIISELYPKKQLVRVVGRRSCETIASEIREQILKLHNGIVAVEVWEDGEVGARVEE